MKPLITSDEAAQRILKVVRKTAGCEDYGPINITDKASAGWKAFSINSGPELQERCLATMSAAADQIRQNFDLSDAIPLTHKIPVKLGWFVPQILENLADAENFLRAQEPDSDNPLTWATAAAAIDAAKKQRTPEAIHHATRALQHAMEVYKLTAGD